MALTDKSREQDKRWQANNKSTNAAESDRRKHTQERKEGKRN